MAVSEVLRQVDLDRCIHCGLCLNACPTYRELGVEMDSPRGRIYQMAHVAGGQPLTAAYLVHIGQCLACRGCESSCPSGVPYGRLIEAARTDIESRTRRGPLAALAHWAVYRRLLGSPALLKTAGALLYWYEQSGLRGWAERPAVLRWLGKLGRIAPLAPSAEAPFFFGRVGETFAAEGERRCRVGMLAGCIANVAFARLNEATVRVLRKNGCEVALPAGQGCCGALHVHAGVRDEARRLARRNIDAFLGAGCDVIVTNAAGCGSTLKEYHELLEDDPAYRDKAREFVAKMRDVTEFLAALGLRGGMQPLAATVTYQDSCHLAHGQKIKAAPRQLLRAVPGLTFREMQQADICCGSAGTYNIVHDELAAGILGKKMACVNATGAEIVATANPGCMLQLRAGVKRLGRGQRVLHVVEVLDEAYGGERRPGVC